ncbi:unnamed protein product [Chondrus crispus]|uniref:Glutaredoxin domain-containing protein n=1 Tax=Chondrus crispus TaxID=2769 RepID=R7QS23_CHOCR|nr:unnamed protein product [Chondrus crispus]CDF40316.1 unnamed protein product [Chondrus crispus]|eukprot:XP_005710610.1 unnamed protein product [Chondrus crispus]
MAQRLPAFSASIALVASKRGSATLSSFTASRVPLVRHSTVSFHRQRPTPRFPQLPPDSIRSPTAQLGNVEDLPAERIPGDAALVPQHWHRPGVYGVYSINAELQYVAAVRDVGAAIATHITIINDPKLVFAVRMILVDTVEQAPLGDIAETWVLTHFEHGPGVPPGNGDAAPIWREEELVRTADIYFPPNTEPEMVRSAIKRVLRENKVLLFMKGTREEPRCGFSKRTVEMLDSVLGNEFVCMDVLDEIRNRGLREEIKKFSEWPTIPQLYVNGDFVGGADIVQSMKDSGELDTLLQPLVKSAN